MPSESLDEKAIFNVARQIGSPDARADYLRQACGTDSGLRERVQVLLRAYEEQASFLELPPPAGVAPAFDQPASESPGTVIGPYKLIEPIGEGGMGTVWMAQQTDPVKRLVALKLIKPGMDSKQVIARFEAERQALALMDHPNIARVLDGGTTGTGRPYFAMDLVKGVPITKYCDEHHLTPRQRLELFLPVCQAVQHAHQKGVIHRDLKPSNVLVALYDGRPVPKVIDFGVAKAAGQPLTEKTLVTGFGAIVGTLEYMSPEQAEVNQLDIDTRSDIYSLGVLLYELLTGTTPLERNRVKESGLLEALRIIREEETPTLSNRLSTTEELPAIAGNRGTEPAKLAKLVRGELDWIEMKALEKDRNRRYETANGFAMDVRRYLADEPVQAGPPSAAYRLRKFVRRNRGPVLAASLVLLAVVGGIFGTTIGLIRADDAREQAETSAERERLAKQQAERRLTQIERGVGLFAGLVQGLKPQDEEKGTPPLYEQLRQRAVKAADELVDDAVGDPLTVARLQTLLGTTMLGLGETGKATELLERARATRQARLGPDHAETLTTLANLASAYFAAGKGSQAIALFEQFRDARAKAPDPDPSETLATLANLASAYLAADRLPEAIALYEQVHELQVKTLEADHPDALGVQHNQAVAYWHSGKLPRAIALFEQVRDARVRKLGADHFETLATLASLAAAYRAAGRLPEAIAQLEQVRDAQVKKLGVGHFSTLVTLEQLALAYQAANRLTEAIALFEQVRDARVREPGADHVVTLATQGRLASAYRAAGRLPEAIALFEQVRDAQVEAQGADHTETLATLNNLALAYRAAGRLPEAIALYEQVHDARLKKQGAGHPNTVITLNNLALALADQGVNLMKEKKWAEAEECLMKLLDIRRKMAPNDWRTFNAMSMLGYAHLGQKEYPDAEPLLLQAYEGMKSLEAKNSLSDGRYLTKTLLGLVHLYEAWGKPAEAAKWRKQVENVKDKP